MVSIAIVTFNNLVFTRMCLASLLGNTHGPAHEVIVVDNASSDGTVAYLRAVAAANPYVRIILNDANRGFAPANNQALAQATGDVLVLLNNDTIVSPGWLTGLVHHLEDPMVGLVGPVTNRIGNEAEIETDYTTYAQFVEFAGHVRWKHQDQVFDIPTPCMFCLAMRRDALERIGPLDERFEIGMLEDDDYALRARAAGYRAVCAEDVFVHHFGEATFGNLVPTGEYGKLIEANRQRFQDKWGVPWQAYGRRQNARYARMVETTRQLVESTLPPGATVLVVSRGDSELVKLTARTAWHFPQTPGGLYAGHYPRDSAAAIDLLEDTRAKGAQFLVFPTTALWWLEHYREFKEHLQSRYRVVLHAAESCVIFGLEEGTAGRR